MSIIRYVYGHFLCLLQTPPSSYRRQVDLQYNSLPRQSFPMLVNSTNGSSVNVDEAAQQQTTSPKQRNVAFGKSLTLLPTSSTSSSPAINKRSGGGVGGGGGIVTPNNVYHHQLVLYQQRGTSPLPGYLTGFEKQRGFSVPNLGLPQNTFSLNSYHLL